MERLRIEPIINDNEDDLICHWLPEGSRVEYDQRWNGDVCAAHFQAIEEHYIEGHNV